LKAQIAATVVPKKTWTGPDANAVAFRTSTKPDLFDSASVIVWENSIPIKSAARHEPYTTGSLSNREIANTSNPDVSHESSSPGVVAAQSGEIPATPSGPYTPPGMAPANSIEGSAAPRGTIPQSLRPGASANAGKPALGLTKPLGRKPAVPVTPLFRTRVPGTPAPFSSVAAEEAEEKGRRRPKSAVSGKQFVGLRQGGPTKASAKLRKPGKRKVEQKKGKRQSWDDSSDWC
jgi:hypothetical protein